MEFWSNLRVIQIDFAQDQSRFDVWSSSITDQRKFKATNYFLFFFTIDVFKTGAYDIQPVSNERN